MRPPEAAAIPASAHTPHSTAMQGRPAALAAAAHASTLAFAAA